MQNVHAPTISGNEVGSPLAASRSNRDTRSQRSEHNGPENDNLEGKEYDSYTYSGKAFDCNQPNPFEPHPDELARNATDYNELSRREVFYREGLEFEELENDYLHKSKPQLVQSCIETGVVDDAKDYESKRMPENACRN